MVCGGGGGAAVLAYGGVVKGRQCACTRTCKHTPIFSVPQQVQHRSHSTKQLQQGSCCWRLCRRQQAAPPSSASHLRRHQSQGATAKCSGSASSNCKHQHQMCRASCPAPPARHLCRQATCKLTSTMASGNGSCTGAAEGLGMEKPCSMSWLGSLAASSRSCCGGGAASVSTTPALMGSFRQGARRRTHKGVACACMCRNKVHSIWFSMPGPCAHGALDLLLACTRP